MHIRTTLQSTLHRLSLFFACTSILFAQFAGAQQFVVGDELPGTFPNAAQFADFDGDGDQDLVRSVYAYIGTSTLNANEVWFNDGSGDFILHQLLGNTPSYGVAVGDVDNDGDIDLFFANDPANRVWLNDGNGNFTDSGQLLGNQDSGDILLIDVDQDGDLDAYVGNKGGVNSYNKVWLNDGTGHFTDSGQLIGISNNVHTSALSAADVDQDGDIDVVEVNCCSPQNAQPQLWLNDGNGNFTMSGQVLSNDHARDVLLQDLNGDSYPDLIFANILDPSPVYLNDGNGNFTYDFDILPNSYAHCVISADFDLDNVPDLLIGQFDDHSPAILQHNNGDGTFTDIFHFMDSSTVELAYADVDNDTDIDVFTVNQNFQPGRIWLNMLISHEYQETRICTKDSIFLGGSWVSTAGIYTDTFTNTWGHDSIVTTTLSFTDPDTTVTINESILSALETDADYQWINCISGTELNGETSMEFSPVVSGYYAVVLTQSACKDTSGCHYFDTKVIQTAGLAESTFPEMRIYPNPNSGTFTADLGKTFGEIRVTITDLQGKMHFSEIYMNRDKLQLSLSSVPGVYFVAMETEMGSKVYRVVRE